MSNSPYQRTIEIANPSPYSRSDYVEVDLTTLEVPAHLDESSLSLFRVKEYGRREEIPYQLDHVFGPESPILTFYADSVESGPDPDYKRVAARFELKEQTPDRSLVGPGQNCLGMQHFDLYDRDKAPTPTWNRHDGIRGVKLANGAIEIFVSLIPHHLPDNAVNYNGCVTSVRHFGAEKLTSQGEMLAPFWGSEKPKAVWGQLTHLDFYPLPWERRWYHVVPVIPTMENPTGKREYTLEWSRCGPMRCILSVKSDPFPIRYEGHPFFRPIAEEVLQCRLYRVFSLYPNREFYAEQTVVRWQPNTTLAFRAHFRSFLDFPNGVSKNVARYENVPDHFALWRFFSQQLHHGYGVASDSHIRALHPDGNEIRWRLQLNHIHNCVHYFMIHGYPMEHFDPSKRIGHEGWYERVYKPLRVIPLTPYLPRG